MRLIDEGTVADVDQDGRLLGLMVLAPERDWTAQLEEILREHQVPPADAETLRAVALPQHAPEQT